MFVVSGFWSSLRILIRLIRMFEISRSAGAGSGAATMARRVVGVPRGRIHAVYAPYQLFQHFELDDSNDLQMRMSSDIFTFFEFHTICVLGGGTSCSASACFRIFCCHPVCSFDDQTSGVHHRGVRVDVLEPKNLMLNVIVFRRRIFRISWKHGVVPSIWQCSADDTVSLPCLYRDGKPLCSQGDRALGSLGGHVTTYSNTTTRPTSCERRTCGMYDVPGTCGVGGGWHTSPFCGNGCPWSRCRKIREPELIPVLWWTRP